MVDDVSNKDVDRQLQIMTTMHFVLAGARSATVYESVGRAGMYLTTVSMTLVALGFIGTATKMSEGFYVFAFVLLSCLVFLGLVSFEPHCSNRSAGLAAQPRRGAYPPFLCRDFSGN